MLDYTLNMRSLNHQGLLFDNLNFSNFGYGGDPNDVTRLRIEKDKWYDFSYVFRRDKYFWDYNLLANPFNPVPIPPTGAPASFAITNPAFASTNSPHSLDLVHRMQDFDLTLLPQSRMRFRLGYSRNVEEGPGLTTEDATVEIPMAENFEETTNAYRMGVDFKVLPKTTISYDQFLEWNKYDTSRLACQHAISSPKQSVPRHTAREYGSQLVLRPYWHCCRYDRCWRYRRPEPIGRPLRHAVPGHRLCK